MKFIFILLLIFFTNAHSEEQSLTSDLLSPATTNARYVFLSGTLATAFLVVFEDQIVDTVQNEISLEKPLGKGAKYFDYGGRGIPNALYFLYMGTGSLLTKNNYYMSRASLIFKSSAYSGIVITALKYSIREPRPNNPQERNSFPSGHAGMAFSFASTIGMSHPWPYGLLAYIYATGVAYSRINDNRHYLHDVVAGATIGASYGIALAQKNNLDSKQTFFQLLPTQDLAGLQFCYLIKI